VKASITPAERLQLIGLLTLADHHDAALKDIERAAAELLQVPPDEPGQDYYGHLSDAMYDGNRRSADRLLDLLKITVADEPPPVQP
jgi:hypothetical protein